MHVFVAFLFFIFHSPFPIIFLYIRRRRLSRTYTRVLLYLSLFCCVVRHFFFFYAGARTGRGAASGARGAGLHAGLADEAVGRGEGKPGRGFSHALPGGESGWLPQAGMYRTEVGSPLLRCGKNDREPARKWQHFRKWRYQVLDVRINFPSRRSKRRQFRKWK